MKQSLATSLLIIYTTRAFTPGIVIQRQREHVETTEFRQALLTSASWRSRDEYQLHRQAQRKTLFMVLKSKIDEENPEELRNLAERAERQVSEIESIIAEAESALQLYEEDAIATQEQAQKEKQADSEERNVLLQAITDFTKMIEMKDDEIFFLKDGFQEREKKTEEDIARLKSELELAYQELERRKQAATQMKDQLLKAEDKLEFEQMEYKKQREALDRQYEQERSELQRTTTDLEEQNEQFEKENVDIEAKYEVESEKFRELKAALRQEQEEFETTKKNLENLIETQRAKLSEETERLNNEQNRVNKERAELRVSFNIHITFMYVS